jgi:hypothetical protein
MIGEVSLQCSMMYAAATRKVILFAFTWQTETFTCLGCVCEDITLAPFLFFFGTLSGLDPIRGALQS